MSKRKPLQDFREYVDLVKETYKDSQTGKVPGILQCHKQAGLLGNDKDPQRHLQGKEETAACRTNSKNTLGSPRQLPGHQFL